MFSYLPLRTYVLPLLIISSIFSLKGQEKEQEAPEEQTIKRYKGFKLEFAVPVNRFAIYPEGGFGLGLVLLAPQYYIRSNISMGLQYEADVGLLAASQTFMVTGDYYFTNKKNRISLGLGVGTGNGGGVVSPRFKLHRDWFIIHSSYNISAFGGLRVGVAFTLFGKKK